MVMCAKLYMNYTIYSLLYKVILGTYEQNLHLK